MMEKIERGRKAKTRAQLRAEAAELDSSLSSMFDNVKPIKRKVLFL